MRARNIPEVSVRPLNPDFVALADAFGCRTATPRSLEEIEDAIRGALSADRPTIILVRQEDEYLR
jgi:5-guanidino-2-oxopentanoate decarboxylase